MHKILLLVLVVVGVLGIAGSALAGVDDRWFAVMPGGGEIPD